MVIKKTFYKKEDAVRKTDVFTSPYPPGNVYCRK